MSNHLKNEISPYLLQHATNPVDWYPWGPEAIDRAANENKPIFLSIGYAACHWCHVMAHESFENPGIAELLNEHFISIKVDREERPDLDSIYMNAITSMSGQGGWPLNVFLLASGQPFYGGTYFPPDDRYNLPSFRDVLLSIIDAWQNDRPHILDIGQRITNQLHVLGEWNSTKQPPNPQILEDSRKALMSSYDWKYAGWGSAPKFPQAMTLEFLICQAIRGDTSSLEMVEHMLDAMSRGGMYDLVGGGFHRYSTDNDWLVPHFEKMLYDNALLAGVYLHAFCLTRNLKWRIICEETLDFIKREMTDPLGGFYSSLDADAGGQEGSFYVWSPTELRQILGESIDADLFFKAFGVTDSGNHDGSNILRRALSDLELAKKYDLSIDVIRTKLQAGLALCRRARNSRVHPATDDKIIVVWNAFALKAFAEAAFFLNRHDYLEIAIRNADFLLDTLYAPHLFRSWRSGRIQVHAFLEDYAALSISLLALYQADPDLRWFSNANKLAKEMIDLFTDPRGGFFDSPNDQVSLILRPKDVQDNATPSGNSLAAHALLLLAEYDNNPSWRSKAEELLSTVQSTAVRYPTAFAYWLTTLDFVIGPLQQVALLSQPGDPGLSFFIDVLQGSYQPRRVVAIGDFPLEPGSPFLLQDRGLVNQQPTAYVCEEFACRLPTNSPIEMRNQLMPVTKSRTPTISEQ